MITSKLRNSWDLGPPLIFRGVSRYYLLTWPDWTLCIALDSSDQGGYGRWGHPGFSTSTRNKIKIDIIDGSYIFSWLEKLLTTYEFPKNISLNINKSYCSSKKYLWSENWTPRWLNTGPPVSPTGTDAPARVMQLDWSRFLCTTKPSWGPRSQRVWPHTWDPRLTPTHQPLA